MTFSNYAGALAYVKEGDVEKMEGGKERNLFSKGEELGTFNILLPPSLLSYFLSLLFKITFY